jgi:glycosyltransferase involved in cell wall biosynthesis
MGLFGGIASVALVSEHASPIAPLGGEDAGGQNVYVAELARELGEHEIDVVVYTRRDDPSLPRRVRIRPRVTLEHIDAGPPARIAKDAILPFVNRFGLELARAWRRRRPDVVHAHYWMSGLAAQQAAAPLRIPLVQTFHAAGITKRRHHGANDPSSPARVSAEVALASMVDAVASTSTEELADLRGCGARPRAAEVVPCGVNTTLFTPGRSQRGPTGRLVTVGRLVPRKGVDDVVCSLRWIPGARLVIAGGSGRAEDADARRLSALAQAAGVADRVELIGPVEHARVPELLRSADVVACVPWYEPFGMVALEAMACGVPVVSAAVGGLRETVVDGETGLHVPPRDPPRIAAAVRTLLGDEQLRARLGAHAAERAASVYAWSTIADSLLGLYVRVAQGGTP